MAFAGISPREWEVLSLVGEHLTNAEIADRLVISVRTVENHVSSLLRKLGVEDRRGLARALRQGRRPDLIRLPAPLSPLIGRRPELDQLLSALSGARLITVTGPGGAGKTRLGVEAAQRLAGSFGEGAWFVELAPLADPAQVAATAAGVLSLTESAADPLAALIDYLRHRRALLLLDNCEHLLDACAGVAAALTQSCPRLTVLATSRERLAVPGEFVVRLGGLDAGAAVELFLAHGSATDPGFDGRAADAQLDRICAELDRLPLAIELAAAQVTTSTLDELESALTDRFSVLRDQRRGGDPRHRALSDVMSWSVSLLDADERAALVALAVFAGPFSRSAAEAIIGSSEAGVDILVRRSLLARDTDLDGYARFRMLATVREFAAGLDAGAITLARRRHVVYHLRLAGEAVRGMRTDQSPVWMNRLRAAADDLRVAVTDAFTTDPETAARLVAALHWPWLVDGRLAEYRAWAEQALGTGVPDPRLRAVLAWGLEYGEAETRNQVDAPPVDAIGDELIGMGHAVAGAAAWARGDTRRAAEHHRAALRHVRRCGKAWPTALVSALAGRVAYALGNHGEADRLLGEATVIAEELREPYVLGFALDYQATVWLDGQRFDDAAPLAERSLAAYRAIGFQEGIASALALTAAIALHGGDLAEAETRYAEVLELCLRARSRGTVSPGLLRTGLRGGIAAALDGLGLVAAERGDPQEAARLLGAADHVRSEIDLAAPGHLSARRDQALAALAELLGDEFRVEQERGRSLRLEAYVSARVPSNPGA